MEEKTMRVTNPDNYGDSKWSKYAELNPSMSITSQPRDEYTRTIESGGDGQ